MNEFLFRKKSIDRVRSPEQLNDYLRVANPGVWMILIAILVLLAGVCVWGCLGHLATVLETVAISRDGEITVYVKEADVSSVKEGMKVTIEDKEYSLAEISPEPSEVDETFSEYALHVGSFKKGEWVYAIRVEGKVTKGVHKADIVTDSVSPISFVIN